MRSPQRRTLLVRRSRWAVTLLLLGAAACGTTTTTTPTPATVAATAPPATSPSTSGTQPAPSTTAVDGGPTTTTPRPIVADATHGVIRGRVVIGKPGERITPVTAQIAISTATPSETHAVGFTLDTEPDGTFAVVVSPDRWTIKVTTAEPTQPSTSSCADETIDVGADMTVVATLRCVLAPA